jgi:hypothetical protein
MRAKFKQSGYYDVLTSSEYTDSTDKLQRGDILVREGHHTIMVLKNGNEVPEDPDEPIPDDPIIEEEEPPVPIEQIVTPIIETPWTDQHFNYSESSMQKVYIRVKNEYKQAAVYLSGSPVTVHLNK